MSGFCRKNGKNRFFSANSVRRKNGAIFVHFVHSFFYAKKLQKQPYKVNEIYYIDEKRSD